MEDVGMLSVFANYVLCMHLNLICCKVQCRKQIQYLKFF